MHEALAKLKFEKDLAALGEVLIRTIRITVNSMAYPVLDITFHHSTPLRLKMVASNWDEVPPSVELLDASGSPCSTPVPGGIFHPGPHPDTGKPFVCMRGTLEYHTHPSHTNEVWEQYRGADGMDLLGIALQIGNTWRKVVT